jgi:hypothetical protein
MNNQLKSQVRFRAEQSSAPASLKIEKFLWPALGAVFFMLDLGNV